MGIYLAAAGIHCHLLFCCAPPRVWLHLLYNHLLGSYREQQDTPLAISPPGRTTSFLNLSFSNMCSSCLSVLVAVAELVPV